MRKFLICTLLGLTVSAAASPAAEKTIHPQTFTPPSTATTLTVYSGGYAFIEVRQPIDFAGADAIFLEVASTVIPDSIVFMPLDPAVILQEQRYSPGRKFDAASILREHIGDTVRVAGWRRGRIEGTLVNVDGHLVVAMKDGVEIIRDYGHILLVGKMLPDSKCIGDEARNGVHLDTFTTKPGRYDTRLFYEAGGIGWRAHYNAILSDAPALINAGSRAIEEPGRHLWVDLHGQATITNGSDNDFGAVTIRLVAGDVRRQRARRPRMMLKAAPQMMKDAGGGGFEQKAFFEHHLYTLGRRMSLPKRSSVQTELFPVIREMAAEKVLVFNASPPHVSPYPVTRPDTSSAGTVDVSLRLKNASEHPWPAGTIRFSKVDDDKLVFIGEGAIGHTPVGKSVSMSLGTAFDVKAERKRTGFNVKRSPRQIGNEVVEITEAFETTIHNHKDTAVTVYVRETMWRWLTKFKFSIDEREQILSSFEKYNFTSDVPGRTVEIELHIPPNSKATVKYDIRYYR